MTHTKNVKRNAFLKHGLFLMVMFTMLLSVSAQAQNPGPPDLKNATPGPDGVYGIVEKIPSFPGGMNALNAFLAKNIVYPAADMNNNIQGKVVVQFVVELDGSLTDMKVVRAPSAAMGAEAVRVLSTSAKWIPGMQNGQKVRARYTNVVNFILGKQG